jgi:uncharacterized protein
VPLVREIGEPGARASFRRCRGMSDVLQQPLRFLARLPALALIGCVRFYQAAIGPWLPSACRYTPSCSQYSILALREYGAARGTVLTVWRILRCNPFGGHGYDPPRWFGERLPEQPPACGCEGPEAPDSEGTAHVVATREGVD